MIAILNTLAGSQIFDLPAFLFALDFKEDRQGLALTIFEIYLYSNGEELLSFPSGLMSLI